MDQDQILRSNGAAKPLPPSLLQLLCASSDTRHMHLHTMVLRVFGVH